MYSRIRHPETCRISLSLGDWIIVKKHLTAGETRAIWSRMVTRLEDGTERVRSSMVGLAKMAVYLVDWSIVDADGNSVIIRNQSEDYIASTLDTLDIDSFSEIHQAIETHEAAMEAVRAEEKKILAGSIPSNPILPSLAPSDGDTNGYPN